jgi:lysophospholipase L1-like esterase
MMKWFVLSMMGVSVWAGDALASEQVLVVGDSLSKEYQSEFVALYPDHRDAWEARNWNELLDDKRAGQFDLGSWSVYADFRLTGHAYNCSKPGGTAREFRNFLRQDQAAEDEIKESSGGNLIWEFFPTWRETFNELINGAEKIVVFFGGNDLALGNTDPLANPEYNGQPKQIDYESIYAGTFGDASDPDRLRDSIRKNIRSIVQYFRVPPQGKTAARFTGPMVLCSVPHVGCTPKVQHDAGTGPTRTAKLTAMIEQLNSELRAMALEFDMGFADIYPITKAILDPEPFTIGGVTFKKETDDDCRPRYLFSGDGFHPNTPAQAKIAQVIVDAFRAKYPTTHGSIPRLSDREIIEEILELEKDTGYQEWLAANSVPAAQQAPGADPDGDRASNVLEYSLIGRSPMVSEGADPVAVRGGSDGTGPFVAMDYTPRYAECAYCELTPEQSLDLHQWSPVPASAITTNPDGSVSARVAITPGSQVFLRLSAAPAP